MAIKALEQMPTKEEEALLQKWRDNRGISMEEFEDAMNTLDQEPCVDAIDRAEAIKIASGYCHPANVAKELAKLPAVTPQPKTGGEWIEHPEIETSVPEYLMFYECSECGDRQCFCKLDIYKKKFCSNCGCRMVEPQERSNK